MTPNNSHTSYFTRPENDPYFPEDITLSEYDEIGKLQSLYTTWIGYISIEVAKLKGEIEVLDEDLKFEEAKALISINEDDYLRNLYKAKEDRLAWVGTRTEIAEKRRKKALMNAQLEMEKTVLENFRSRYACASRELTRRTEE